MLQCLHRSACLKFPRLSRYASLHHKSELLPIFFGVLMILRLNLLILSWPSSVSASLPSINYYWSNLCLDDVSFVLLVYIKCARDLYSILPIKLNYRYPTCQRATQLSCSNIECPRGQECVSETGSAKCVNTRSGGK